ncbi:alkaline phosphatase [Akkermansia sp. N21169]|jgi:predicted AlkP superfamily pyrophosphatase or phosphodiesterase|uniref:alkaline phosphatase n=1 Tax=unclassified Akkermansia TaxID=2608915 RepID=UPI00244EAD51|nr:MULTISPECIES: alkaline phosphatase [unclassified Akkermansia]MDH3067866.1 alkaline phosphatase [Akkermansia sp. N21169]WPX41691.1 alkaline phosphatase [Akkermansia sp. N21116]
MNIKHVTMTVLAVLCLGSVSMAAPTPVILIGVDGFSAEMYNKYKKDLPNLTALEKSGASTTEMRSVLPSSSAINWKSMLSGSPTELHGFTKWGSKSPELPSREIGNYGQYPGIFGILRDQRPTAVTGCFYDWEGIKYLMEEDAISESKNAKPDEIVKLTESFLKRNPQFIFIHLDITDGAGHKYGWESKEYEEACKTADKVVGELVQAVKKSPMNGKMAIFFASDHGGKGKNHGGITLSEVRTPFIMAGPGIKRNEKITDSTMVYDITATIAKLLELKQPQVWTGRPIEQGLLKK